MGENKKYVVMVLVVVVALWLYNYIVVPKLLTKKA